MLMHPSLRYLGGANTREQDRLLNQQIQRQREYERMMEQQREAERERERRGSKGSTIRNQIHGRKDMA